MVVPLKLVPLLVALAIVLAGCTGNGGGGADGGENTPGEGAPQVEATETTGGIRGVVVDDRIVPIKGATIVIQPANKSIESDKDGLFAVSGLQPGDYIVQASHPLYNEIQQTTTVVAGDSNPKALKLQLTRTIFANPYALTQKFEGYIVCSAGHGLVGYSEECGEGVGSPADSCAFGNPLGLLPCVPNPVNPGQRIGGQGNNNVQYDFFIDSADIRTIQVEMKWEATAQTAASGQLLTFVSTNWLCDPFCGGELFGCGASASPMLMRSDVNATEGNMTIEPTIHAPCEDFGLGKAHLALNEPITAFTWANPNTVDPVTGEVPLASVILQQSYLLFVTTSYVLPLPEGWSFVGESPPPFS